MIQVKEWPEIARIFYTEYKEFMENEIPGQPEIDSWDSLSQYERDAYANAFRSIAYTHKLIMLPNVRIISEEQR